MIVTGEDTLAYLLHRIGETRITELRRADRKALEGNVSKYEAKNGEITTAGEAQPGKKIGFQ